MILQKPDGMMLTRRGKSLNGFRRIIHVISIGVWKAFSYLQFAPQTFYSIPTLAHTRLTVATAVGSRLTFLSTGPASSDAAWLATELFSSAKLSSALSA